MARKTTPAHPRRVGECADCVPIATDPSKYDLSASVLLAALNPIKVYESIISSGIAGTEYGRLPWLVCTLALSVMSAGHTSNAASEGTLPFDCAAYHVGLADFHG